MQKPMVVILHTTPGRLRISLSWPPQKVDRFIQGVLGHSGINSVKYNPITKSVLITYTKEQVEPTEIVIRVATSLSLEYNFVPVLLSSKLVQKGLGVLDQYSGLALLAAWGVKLLDFSLPIQRVFLWNGTFSTIISIMSHAWMEAKKRGVYDPEVLSLAYLINSILKENLLFSTTLTWLTAFGRHIWELIDNSMSLQAFKVYEKEEEVPYYDVIISSEKENSPLKQLGKALLNLLIGVMGVGPEYLERGLRHQVRSVSSRHQDRLEGVGSSESPMFLRLAY